MDFWDCIIVGGGPAGLSAAIYMGRFRRRTLLIDSGDGRWSYGQVNENYLGFPSGIDARSLHELGRAQAERFGVIIRDGSVTGIAQSDGHFELQAGDETLRAETVIWATGVKDHWPDFPNVRELVGHLLYWCIICDGWRTRGKRVVLISKSEQVVETALQFLTYTRRITYLADPGGTLSEEAQAELEAEGIRVLRDRVQEVRVQDESVCQVRLEGGEALEADYLFSLLGSTPRTELLKDLPVERSASGHVRVDDKGYTSLKNFFAAGDVSDKHSHQVVSAAHEGAMAAQAANHVLYDFDDQDDLEEDLA